ncbi:LOW QUALITY PROTEIN: hypothetical protein PHMEG_00011921 [Phytophthora megakarya]|uniref:Uncharacterized protein n=1 Tax=Phytophthora megakarya TaxID=4795 RepID=A0A225WAK0_9STRA|nr:LOW QUALITY PROTEIN: hypothetical protein PHMEG_00011921 [Phytophthora megakarya]
MERIKLIFCSGVNVVIFKIGTQLLVESYIYSYPLLRKSKENNDRTVGGSDYISQTTHKESTRKMNYEDRRIGSLLDDYSSAEQFQQICDGFLTLDDIRERTAFLLSHFGLL